MASGPLSTPPSIHADVKSFGQDDGLSIFASMRPRLFGITCPPAWKCGGGRECSCRTFGCAGSSADGCAGENQPAYVANNDHTTVLSTLRPSPPRVRHETSVSEHSFRDAVDTSSDPGIHSPKRGEALELAVLLLFGRLYPQNMRHLLYAGGAFKFSPYGPDRGHPAEWRKQ